MLTVTLKNPLILQGMAYINTALLLFRCHFLPPCTVPRDESQQEQLWEISINMIKEFLTPELLERYGGRLSIQQGGETGAEQGQETSASEQVSTEAAAAPTTPGDREEEGVEEEEQAKEEVKLSFSVDIIIITIIIVVMKHTE